MRQSAVRRSAVEKSDAETLSKQLESVALEFRRKAGEKDHLFGSVTNSDIAEALEQKGFNIDRRKIQVNDPLKSLGDFDIPIRLHRDVTSRIKVSILKEEGEA